jgi:hypothetical protein
VEKRASAADKIQNNPSIRHYQENQTIDEYHVLWYYCFMNKVADFYNKVDLVVDRYIYTKPRQTLAAIAFTIPLALACLSVFHEFSMQANAQAVDISEEQRTAYQEAANDDLMNAGALIGVFAVEVASIGAIGTVLARRPVEQ